MVVNVSNTMYMDIFIWMIGTRDPMRLMAIVIVNIRQMREYDVTYGIVAKIRNSLNFNI